MRLVPLAATPNQAFTVTIDGVRWSLRLVDAERAMAVDVSRDGVLLLSGYRAVAGEPLIPYRYLQTANFVFLTASDEMPEWSLFGVSQVLVYLSAGEVAALPQMTLGEMDATALSYLTNDEGFYLTSDDGALLENA